LFYDLITVDHLLPGDLSGFEEIVHIRHAITPQQLPIILLSGSNKLVLEPVKQTFPDVSLFKELLKRPRWLPWLEERKRLEYTANQLKV
jgi:CheY-like chemotaxis protein